MDLESVFVCGGICTNSFKIKVGWHVIYFNLVYQTLAHTGLLQVR